MSLSVHLVILFAGLALAVFATSLDETIVAVAAVNISDEFNSFNLYDWVTVSYLISLTGVQPLYGQISDVVGRKGPMMTAVAVFFAANAACAWSQSMVSLIIYRTIGGIGGGGMTGLSFVIVADLFPIDERPRYQGILMSGVGVAMALGPVLGGVLTHVASWRWCFWTIMPFAGITFLIIAFIKLPSPTTQPTRNPAEVHSRRDRAGMIIRDLCGIDWLGASLIMCSVTCLIVPLTHGGNQWPWSSVQVILLLSVAVISATGLILLELFVLKDAALVPVRFLKNNALVMAWLNLFVYNVLFMALLYYLPIWFQVVQGYSSTETGLFLLPLVCGLVLVGISFSPLLRLASLIKATLHLRSKAPRHLLLFVGCTFFLLATTLMATELKSAPMAGYVIMALVLGIGGGMVLQSSFLEAQASVPTTVMFQYLGGAIGLAVAGIICRQSLTRQLKNEPEEIIPSDLRQ
ncbi:MFS general substrate transporter [Fusarium acutatum]|uniref:MFS general substrate transporter n=1 Tax=Fusarium acutatum TaxID=78861 RepID=A0A8H4JQ48_9HYPO|nr:MFS general substrate transporter [Fusarium acutatum]